MSKIKSLKSLLSPFTRDSSLKGEDIREASTNLQSASSKTAVFYRLTDAQNADDIFYSRWTSQVGCLITNRLPKNYDGPYILIDGEDFLPAQKCVADELYPLTGERVKIVGVTGTNGKTTTVDFLRQIGLYSSKCVATIGTLGVYMGRERLKRDINSTSPSYLELRKILYELQGQVDLLALEVSSHALSQDRYYDLRFDVAAWTSFSRDHLDYHKTFENYFEAKQKIAEFLLPGKRLLVSSRSKELGEKLSQGPFARRLKLVGPLTEKQGDDLPVFRAPYNCVNIELAWKAFHEVFPEEKLAVKILEQIHSPPGRFMTREKDGRLVVVDYAHTPEALENICQTLGKDNTKKLLTVFGCGGDRDEKKRRYMGEIACRLSDKVIVTSDNPRSESPKQIVADIEEGCFGEYEIIIDREEAIKSAIRESNFAIVLIAGKGHEEYQETQGTRYPFSDIKMVDKYLEEIT